MKLIFEVIIVTNSINIIIQSLLETHKTPILYINSNKIKEKYNKIKDLYPEINILYQVKQNSNIYILKLLYKLGSGFDVQSYNEIKYLLDLNKIINNISFGNTIKSEKALKLQNHYKIKQYAIDTIEELYKVNNFVNKQNIWYRLNVQNKKSIFQMSNKFGQNINEIKNMLLISKNLSVNPYGISFHVGSQNNDINQWLNQLQQIKEIFKFQKENKIILSQINIGGGFPVQYDKNVLSISDILLPIKQYIKNNFDSSIKIYCEPGRYLVQESGIIITKVLLSQKRNNENWVYLDQGIYQGLFEQITGINYTFSIYNKKKTNTIYSYNIGGPSCDGIDIIGQNIKFNNIIKTNDILLIHNTGQYTNDTNTKFNGLYPLNTIII